MAKSFCKKCGRGFEAYPSAKREFCSKSCSKLGRKRPDLIGNTFTVGLPSWCKGLKGIHLSPETEFKKGQNTGENNWNWKGDKVGYYALHAWVERNLGKPQTCELCGDTSDRKYEWANISGNYKRELNGWKRLCTPCHAAFDNYVNKAWETRRRNQLLQL